MTPPTTRTTRLLSLLLALLLAPFLTAAQSTTATSSSSTPSPSTGLQIYNGSSRYLYQGCFNETSDLPGTSGARAIGEDGTGGAHQVLEGEMTATKCLAFCSTANNGSAFKYAGVEYARECWCGAHISALAARVDDAACGLPCDGNASQVCGGPLKLTVYMISAAPAIQTLSGTVVMLVAAVAAFNWV